MPAIKTLKLLAHGDNYLPSSSTQQSHSLIRTSSLNTQKNLTQSKSLRMLSSRLNDSEKQNNDSEQLQTGTDDRDY
jgi:hypothetical protein